MCQGEWYSHKGRRDVAVKMLNQQALEKDKVRFLQEAAIMGQFKHPNIVRLHGVVTIGVPVSPLPPSLPPYLPSSLPTSLPPSLNIPSRPCLCAHAQVIIVLELMKNGNLRNYLRSLRPSYVGTLVT